MRPVTRSFLKAALGWISQVSGSNPAVLEVGSRQVAGPEDDLRPLVRDLLGPAHLYVGVDLAPGPGVDRVVDFTVPGATDYDGSPLYWDVVIMADVLEHASDPAAMVERALALLSDHGHLLVVAPFMFGYHDPPDRWRFTPEGLKLLAEQVGGFAAVSGDPRGSNYPASSVMVASPSPLSPELVTVVEEGEWPTNRHSVILPDRPGFAWTAVFDTEEAREDFSAFVRREWKQ